MTDYLAALTRFNVASADARHPEDFVVLDVLCAALAREARRVEHEAHNQRRNEGGRR